MKISGGQEVYVREAITARIAPLHGMRKGEKIILLRERERGAGSDPQTPMWRGPPRRVRRVQGRIPLHFVYLKGSSNGAIALHQANYLTKYSNSRMAR